MSIASKYNHGTRFDYVIPQDCGFKSLGVLLEDDGNGVVYTVRGLYINHKSKYGDARWLSSTTRLSISPNTCWTPASRC